MSYWTHPAILTCLALGTLLAVGFAVQRRVSVPASIVAGTLGLLLGSSVLGWLPLDQTTLEAGVYHGLGLVFVALGLQRPKEATGRRRQARSMAFGISVMVALQTVVGLSLALALGVHVGLGLLLPLGFEQGPGQAMSLGTAWEASGLVDGGSLGLILAAVGFAWAVFAGVPLVALGRRRGWIRRPSTSAGAAKAAPTAGDADGLSRVLVAVAAVYALTGAVCYGLAELLAFAHDIAAMVWGFHFLVGALVAGGARGAMDRLGAAPLDDGQLTRVSGAVVDLATTAALSAVQLAVLTAWWLPVLVLCGFGGLVTLLACLVLARMGFREDAFEHAVLWFGMSTGTLPVGLALLRAVDPELQSSAPASAVYGSALSIAGVAPIVLALHPLAITGRPVLALGLCAVWLVVLLVGWRALGGLRFDRVASFPPTATES